MITVNIDTTENNYENYSGNFENIDMIRNIIYKNNIFVDCCGTIKLDNSDAILWIAAVKEFGVYLGYNGDIQRLSYNESGCLDKVVDVWGDGLYISEALFVLPQIAWNAICEFVEKGTLHNEIKWIECSKVLEEGNYIL